jgi:hypothetical protein
VEADKNMPNGESLVRQTLYTKKYFKEKFGLNSDQLLLDFEPDTFGHNMSVPEILTKAMSNIIIIAGDLTHTTFTIGNPLRDQPYWHTVSLSGTMRQSLLT